MIPTQNNFYQAPQQQKLPSRLATWLAEKWCPADVIRPEKQLGKNGVCLLPEGIPAVVDIIVPISYTTLRGGLTMATHSNWVTALDILKARTEAAVVYSNCKYPFTDADLEEERLRRKTLEEDYPGFKNPALKFGNAIIKATYSMNNSVKECEAIKDEMERRGLKCDTIVVVTGVGHARDAKKIWQHYFPKSRIEVYAATDFNYEWQPDHYVKVQRGPWLWLFANIARHLLLCTIGVERTGRFRHNSSRE